jgi:hypothetical protein
MPIPLIVAGDGRRHEGDQQRRPEPDVGIERRDDEARR